MTSMTAKAETYAPCAYALCALIALTLPQAVWAFTFVQFLSMFHIVVGLILVVTVLVFVGGLFLYFSRLGTWPSHRETAIRVLEWGVALAFTLVVILAIVRYFQIYPRGMLTVLVLIIFFGILIYIVRRPKEEKKKPGK